MRRNAFWFLAALAACGGGEGGAETDVGNLAQGQKHRVTVARDNDARQAFADVWKVVVHTRANMRHRAIETAGGDPALNGTIPMLAVDLSEETLVFDLGINVSVIDKYEFDEEGTLKIHAYQDALTEDSEPLQRQCDFSATYVDNVSGVRVQQTCGDDVDSWDAKRLPSTDRRYESLSQLQSMVIDGKPGDGVGVARVFNYSSERGNGFALSLMEYPKAWLWVPSDGSTFADLRANVVGVIEVKQDRAVLNIGYENDKTGKSGVLLVTIPLRNGVPDKTIEIEFTDAFG